MVCRYIPTSGQIFYGYGHGGGRGGGVARKWRCKVMFGCREWPWMDVANGHGIDVASHLALDSLLSKLVMRANIECNGAT